MINPAKAYKKKKMKIPFDIKFRPQIQSGEYKVETRDGRIVEILSMNCKVRESQPILAQIKGSKNSYTLEYYYKNGTTEDKNYNLFIITPEPELNEFETSIFKLLRQYKECDIPLTPENIKAEASMLWLDFEKYFFDLYGKEGEGDSALRSFYYKGLAAGKAEALKGLPRWKKYKKGTIIDPFDIVRFSNGHIGRARVADEDCYVLEVADLLKLPGFKEDESHE